jgi:hypothetical protein
MEERLDREAIHRKLVELAAAPRPETRAGAAADCYAMLTDSGQARGPYGAEFICPQCGNRTYYRNHRDLTLPQECLVAMRSLRALGLEVGFDLTTYCETCSAKSGRPRSEGVVFYVRYGEDDIHGSTRFSTQDIELLMAFLRGERKWADGDGAETALHDRLPRLLQLLGFEMRRG